MRDSGAFADVSPRPQRGLPGVPSVRWTLIALAIATLGGCSSGGHKEPADATSAARTDTERQSSYTVTAQVGAERGAALTDESTAKLPLKVDLGADEALPKGSKLLVELSDMTNKDTPRELTRGELDVSGEKDVIDVPLVVPAKALLAAERIALSGRIVTKEGMRAISSVPLLVDGPFTLNGDVAEAPGGQALALDLSHVPNYKKAPLPEKIVVPNFDMQSVETVRPTSVGGPNGK